MGIIGKEEMENLKSLRRDLVDPVKEFLTEVQEDTVGDAARFYAAQAGKAKRRAARAREKTREQMAALRREQEEMKRRRQATMKRAGIVLAALALFSLLVLSAALSVHAEGLDELRLGEDCLALIPPDYENAAVHFRRAGIEGNAEGYYRLGELYENGCLNVGNPCTDDLASLGLEQARKYYALAARLGYAPAQAKLTDGFQSIQQDEAARLMDAGCVVVDVRTREEYDAGHIPGAVCLPVESITEPPALLPDYDRTILLYCRSGRRSKEAARKLAAMGYTDVREFGGILDWGGDIVPTEEDFLAFTGLSEMDAMLRGGAAVDM